MSDTPVVIPVTANYPLTVTVCISLFSITILTWCFGKSCYELANVLAVRTKAVESWRHLSYSRWRILRGFAANDSRSLGLYRFLSLCRLHNNSSNRCRVRQ
jgi:hypothetical protein